MFHLKLPAKSLKQVIKVIVFLQNMEDMEKNHETFLQGAQQELRKEMATLQKKILMDTVSPGRVFPASSDK